ncbi:MAG TPA: DUF2844 domain-containing protein [Acidobacteriaceae bacterium]|jgi:hypothetical protein|nr:DUF2844 domain-containing protein [Acidobacteriaceae bacterium]
MFFPPQARCRALIALAAGVVLVSSPAFASLGSDVNSVEADRVHMNASVSVSQASGYALHEIQSPAGNVVDEYVSPAGKVFAVAWHGQFPPQMQQILGTYFSQYSAALEAQPHRYGHPPLNIQLPGLVVQTAGRLRAHFGRAYIPDQLPEGVTADQIR